MKKFSLLILLNIFAWAWSYSSVAIDLTSSEREQLILEEIQNNIKADQSIDFSWQGDSQSKQTIVKKKDSVNKKPITKPVSKGQSKVEAMLALQRAKIKKMREADSIEAKSTDWMKQKVDASHNWSKKKLEQQSEWREKKKAIMKEWAQAKAQYKKELPKLKKDLTDLSEHTKETIKVTKSIADDHIPKVNALETQIIREDFSIPIRSQGLRSTCSAFAGVRAMEILLRREGRQWDLSEQFFYYASKPKCQSSPCSRKGSWPAPAFSQSIPLENNCPYRSSEKNGNETQIPLGRSCSEGRVKVGQYKEVSTRNDIQSALRAGKPVIGGFKLNEAFYKNRGFVFLKGEADSLIALDKHAAGHALLLIGVLDLPQELWAKQGKHCTLVANSWGEGWGVGGYACLSDAWFNQYRYQFAFLAVEDISLN